ncbi:MAG: hypothetical protein ACRDTE_05400 [Pseudonocardiaceae bacterium]
MAEPPRSVSAPVAGSAARQDAVPRPGRRHYPDLGTVVALLSIAFFALLGIGGPLIGHGVFAGTDELMELAPYQGEGLDRSPVQNYYLDDTWDSGIPNTLLLADSLRAAQLPAWNPYAVAGSPLGAVPTTAALSPATAAYYLLPGYLAPGYVKLIEILLAVTGCTLFLRRLGLGRPAALVGGLVFASSAFLIAWTNWPQTRVAAIVPFLFWALERLVTRRRITDAALVALSVAAMLLGGFPAVTGYALLLGAVYLLVRAVAEHRGHWLRAVGVLAGGAAGVLGGAALSAVQLLPFAALLGNSYLSGRGQTPEDHLPVESLITSIAPWALGSVREDRPPSWYLGTNMIESLSYLGAAALVLVVAAIAAPRAARAVLPRGVWAFLVGATLAGGVVIYGGGAPLAALQQLPVLFADNFVGRARSVLGFLLAALAAVGLEVLLRGERVRGRARWLAFGFGAAVWVGAAALAGWLWHHTRSVAAATDERAGDGIDRLAHLDREMAGGLGFLAAGLVCACALCWAAHRSDDCRRPDGGNRQPDGGRRPGGGNRWPGSGRRLVCTTAAAVLPILITVQALTLVWPFWPRVDRDTFYPVTATHTFLRDHLGHERYAGTWGAMGVGAATQHRLRALTGHTFVAAPLGELVRQVPGTGGLFPTLVNFGVAPEIAGSPVLDRLATRYFVTAPQDQVLGIPRPAPSDGTIAVLHPDEPVTVPVPGEGPLRAVGVTPTSPPGPSATGSSPPGPSATGSSAAEPARLEVTIHGDDGREVASNGRPAPGDVIDQPFLVPVAAERVGPGERLTATLTLRAAGPLQVQATAGGAGNQATAGGAGNQTTAGAPALAAIGGAGDGLRVAYAGSAVVYQRLTALPRIRWASDAVVEPDPSHRLAVLSAGDLTSDQVLLNAPGPGVSGQPARVTVRADGLDEIVVDVAATGAGYLVVADALQTGWAATVDGAPADLVPADHAVVAVAVPEGEHRVRLHYVGPYRGAGLGVTGVAAVVLLGLVGAERRWTRRA